MNQNLVSAVFDDQAEAERAVSELRSAGVNDSAISIVAQEGKTTTTTDGGGIATGDDTGGFVKGLVGGGAVGTLLGIAALAIPGVGPLAAAGAIASSAIPGAALTGAAIGAATGGLAKVLTDHGVGEDDARYYEERVNSGSVFVSVDTSEAGLSSEQASDILYGAGGHSASRARSSSMM